MTGSWTPTRPNAAAISKVFPTVAAASHCGKRTSCSGLLSGAQQRHPNFCWYKRVAAAGLFPKGHAEPGLSHAQAAALEAFEEAGVHGRMEEISFTRYVRRKRAGRSATNPWSNRDKEARVNAHLCEVLRLGAPQGVWKKSLHGFQSAKDETAILRRKPFACAELRIVELARVVACAASIAFQ